MTTPANPPKRVLFLTNSECGQAQTQLSIAYELLSHPDIEVHVASFEELGPRIPRPEPAFPFLARQTAASIGQQDKQIHFHLIDHPSLAKVLLFKNATAIPYMSHPPGFWGALSPYPKSVIFLLGWENRGVRRHCSQV